VKCGSSQASQDVAIQMAKPIQKCRRPIRPVGENNRFVQSTTV
jgi:hypothetical protein